MAAATITASPASVEINGTNKVTVSVSLSFPVVRLENLKATVAGRTYTIGTATGNFDWTPPLALLNAITDAPSATCTIDGQAINLIGAVHHRVYCSFTVNVPASYVPTAPTNLTLTRINNGVPAGWDMILQDKSMLSAAWTASSGTGGATVTRYNIRMNFDGGGAAAWSATETSLAPNRTYPAGTHRVTVWAVDSRGRSSANTVTTFTVEPYQMPGVAGYRCERTDSNGDPSTLGTSITAWLHYQYTEFGGNNSASATVAWRVSGSGNFSAEVTLPQQTSTVLGTSFDPNTAYDVRFTITDALGTSTAFIATVKALSVALEFLYGGDGAAFGKEATNPGELDVAWDLRVRGPNGVIGIKTGNLPDNIPVSKLDSAALNSALAAAIPEGAKKITVDNGDLNIVAPNNFFYFHVRNGQITPMYMTDLAVYFSRPIYDRNGNLIGT